MTFLENQTGFHQQQSTKSLRITTVYTVISDDLANSHKLCREVLWIILGRELPQQADLRHR